MTLKNQKWHYHRELVNSICKDSTDTRTQHTIHLWVFLWPTRPLLASKSIMKLPKCFLSSSGGLAQYCVNFSWRFMHETAVFIWSSAVLFHNFEVSQGSHSHSLKKYGFQFGMSFSLYVHVHTSRSPSNEPKLITQDRWIRNAVSVCTWAWDQRTSVCVNQMSPLKSLR